MIDLEYMTAACAIWDLGAGCGPSHWHRSVNSVATLERKREFLQGYLMERGEPASAEDANTLALDIEVALFWHDTVMRIGMG